MNLSRLNITRNITLSICAGLMVVNTYAASPKQPSISFNNQIITQTADMGRAYTTSTNRTMVPLRMVSETMGFAINWDKKSQTATIQNEGKYVEITIGSKSPKVNGSTKAIDASAELKNGRTYVPVRFVSEALGAQIDFKENVVYISMDGTIVTDPLALPKVDPISGKATYNNSVDFKVLEKYLGSYQQASVSAPVYVDEDKEVVFMVLEKDQQWDTGEFDVQLKILNWQKDESVKRIPAEIRNMYQHPKAIIKEILKFYLPNGAEKLYKILDDGFNDRLKNESDYMNQDIQSKIGSDAKKVVLTFNEFNEFCVRISK